MMDLPAGTYHVNATVADAGTQEFDITLGANARRVRVVRYESAGGISVPSERQASSDDETATTTRMNRNNAAESGALTAQYVTLKKQYDALSKAVADQNAMLRDHRQTYDALSRKHDDLRDQARALEQQCSGLQVEFQALQRRRTGQRSWTPSQTQRYMEAQNAYTAKQSQCDERNRGIASEQAQYDMQLGALNGLIAMDVAENARLTMRLRQAKADIDSYLAMQR
jgi:chromosome segregation ATPase